MIGDLAPGGRARSVGGTHVQTLNQGWELCATPAGEAQSPADLGESSNWSEAIVPGTVAMAVGGDDLDSHAPYDALDWWYRTSFDPVSGGKVYLHFAGLASLAEVWLNGEPILRSRNMFVPARIEVTTMLRARNHLVIAFRSLEAELAQRRPRPRWKTKLVHEQKLRWFRTTLLGRIPGWTPAIDPVGPWRPVALEIVDGIEVEDVRLRAGWTGSSGTLSASFVVGGLPPSGSAEATLEVGGASVPLDAHPIDGKVRFEGEVSVDGVDPWWPHTHGHPTLYPAHVIVRHDGGETRVDCGRVGFRDVTVERTDETTTLSVNGLPIFCRGACWTTNDLTSLVGAEDDMRATLELVAEANANMVRVGGTMVYETDAFYDACDELGIMVWQDFMFANMDYPAEDPDFAANVEEEARFQVRRLSAHPSVVAWCGGSEIEQQAAMFGAPRESWRGELIGSLLPAIVEQDGFGLPYWPSTPTGGALPFHVGTGLGHYYGVGAYLRPLEDARLSPVAFSPECLGFSNVPEPPNLRLLSRLGVPAPHDPLWKRGVPRDSGAGWDFEDVRDHYLGEVFGEDPVELRSHDLERYHALSRIVTGVVMARVFDEWRSPRHPCSGGLVWFLKDIRPGAGWGIIDSHNEPKPAYWFLKRAWAPIRLAILDRGVDGLVFEIVNETGDAVDGSLHVTVVDAAGRSQTEATADPVHVPSRGMLRTNLAELTDHFVDANYTYRFGPLRHAVVFAELRTGHDAITASHWVSTPREALRSTLSAELDDSGDLTVVSSDHPSRGVRIDVDGVRPGDNYFDLPPSTPRVVRLSSADTETRGYVEALDAPDGVRIRGHEG